MDSTQYPALILTIRFPFDLPDLRLPPIPKPAGTAGLSILPLIRKDLPESQSTLKMLLIHSGRIIALKEPLAISLGLPSNRSLGKFRAQHAVEDADGHDGTIHRIIHATLTAPDSPLTAEELVAEKHEGYALNAVFRLSQGTDNHTDEAASRSSHHEQVPQGFDRLVTAGISADEVASLRAQFRALLAAERPSDAPLVLSDILALEERWLDEAASPANNGNLLLSLGDEAADTEYSNRIDDILWGNMLGFFWPLGTLFWLNRQDGIWRDQRSSSVWVGFLINIGFCLIAKSFMS